MAGITFVEVVDTGPNWNKVLASDGNTYTLRGDYNWRSNNPGNIEYGPFARSMGAIGSGAVPAGRSRGFAIFPSYEMGSAAQSALIFDSPSYRDLTVAEAIARYAPAFENDTNSYANQVAAAAGVTLDTRMSDLTPQQRQAFLTRQQQVEGFNPGTIAGEDGVAVPAEVVRQFSSVPLPPMGLGDETSAPTDILQTLHDRVAQTQGYGQIPPTPVIRSDVLTELRDRAQGVAAAGITPRLVMAEDQPIGRIDPPLAPGMLPEAEGIYAGGLGSLLTDPMSPTMPNPRRTLLAEQLGVRPLEVPPVTPPTIAPTFQPNMMQRGQPTVAPVQEDLRAPASPLSGPAAGRPGGATEVPTGGGIDNASPTVAPVPRQQQTARLPSGREVTIGQSYIAGDRLMIAEIGPDGNAVMRDVEDVRDQWLRDNVDQNAPLLLEQSLAGNAARMIAAPMIRDQFGQAVDSARGSIGDLFGNAVRTVGGTVMQARDTLGGMFSPRPAVPSANANLDSARAEQAARRPRTTAPVLAQRDSVGDGASFEQLQTMFAPRRTAPLPPATQTADSVARNAISAVPRPAAPAMTSVPVTETISNPAYQQWVDRYGDGSQVQTAATGGNITRNQLAAIQNVSGAVQAPIRPVAPPPPPPMTITRVTTRMVPTNPAAPVTMTHDKTTAPSLGAMTPVQRLQASGLSPSQAYAAAVSRNNSGSGTTSWGTSRTQPDGSSWAA